MTRLYPILDTAALLSRQCSPLTAAKAWLMGGARILQIRHKQQWSREFFEQAQTIAELCLDCGAQLVINDRADFALLLNAGLHVGQEDLTPTDARRVIGPDRMLGYSTHSAEQLADAAGEPATYVALGPIFGTANKENPDPEVGLAKLRACRWLVPQPLVAIGGITRENALAVLEAGADSVAVIGDLLPEVCTDSTLRERFETWQHLIQL